uniref:Uncharacterized protein n=1 Tax=Magallana gigas TaxID=29159 RepID=K1Q7F5_MAGGI
MAASFYSTRKKERERKARKQEGNMTKRGQRQTDEKDDPLIILREDIERIRASISDSSLTHSFGIGGQQLPGSTQPSY